MPCASMTRMSISIFNRASDNKPKSVNLAMDSLIPLLTKHEIRADRDGKLFSPATFSGKRNNQTLVNASAVCLDFDHGQPAIDEVLQLFPDTTMVYYSTHSHCWKSKASKKLKTVEDRTYTPEHPRFRVFIPLSRPVDVADHARLVAGVKSIIPPELMDCLDTTCFEMARMHYLPSCPPEHEQYAFAGHHVGDSLDVERFISLGRNAVVPEVKPVKAALQAEVREKEKGVPSIENWHTQIFPRELAHPAWKVLPKSAADILIICKAKSGRAAKHNQKDNAGRPIFEFTQNEAVKKFHFTPPTFTTGINRLIEVGFIDKHRQGGMSEGKGIPNQFRLSNRWETCQAPVRDTANIEKAREKKSYKAGLTRPIKAA